MLVRCNDMQSSSNIDGPGWIDRSRELQTVEFALVLLKLSYFAIHFTTTEDSSLGQGFADDRGDFGAEEFDGVHELVVAQGCDAHLEANAGDAAEGLVHLQELGGYGFGVADHERAGWSAKGFELAASDWWPATFTADLGEGFGVAGEEVIGGLLVGVGDVAEGMDADLERLGCVTGALAGFAIDVDEGAEAVRLAADDGDHEW